MASTLSSSENKLCASCVSLVRRLLLQKQDQEVFFLAEHHSHGQSFFDASEFGCRICSVLLQYHLRTGGYFDNSFQTEASVQSFPRDDQAPWCGDIVLTVKHAENTSWMPNGRYIQIRASLFLQADRNYEILTKTCRLLPLSDSTDDPSVDELAGQWLEICTKQGPGHSHCNMPATEAFRPARLLDVGGDGIRLSLENQANEAEPYCALSYCWGTSGQVVLTASNEAAFCQNIDFQSLPQTIKDAITVTRRLSIRYIWIDSLCIIQSGDDGKDWTSHARQMSKIYTHCVLNLSADRASAVHEGFLHQRTLLPIRPIFYGDLTTLSKCVISFQNAAEMALATEPLGSRAWVFGERILSPRTLHFGAGEVFWECAGVEIASESCPQGFITSVFLGGNYYANFKFSDQLSENMRDWSTILDTYSPLALTVPDMDKLVALAGVAEAYETHTGNHLVAGISKEGLPGSLLWTINLHSQAALKRSPTYRAPSWSWANLDGPLQFYRCGKLRKSASLATVLDVWAKPKQGHNHLGQLDDGAITIRGPVMSVAQIHHFVGDQRGDKKFFPVWDEADRPASMSDALAIFLVVRYVLSDCIEGLLITPAEKKDVWIRAGSFALDLDQNQDAMI